MEQRFLFCNPRYILVGQKMTKFYVQMTIYDSIITFDNSRIRHRDLNSNRLEHL